MKIIDEEKTEKYENVFIKNLTILILGKETIALF